MPLFMLDALPDGQVIVNTDDIVAIRRGATSIEIVLRGVSEPVRVPHSSVPDVVRDLRDPYFEVVISSGS